MKKLLVVLLITLVGCKNYKREINEVVKVSKNKGYNTEFAILIDYSKHSGLKRGMLINIQNEKVLKSFLVAHGSGSKSKNGIPTKFSNVSGSNATSLGMAVLDGRDYSGLGIKVKYWLKGLDKTNSNIKNRTVVLHSYRGIKDYQIYPFKTVQSKGCPTVSDNTMRFLDKFIKKQKNKRILIYSFSNEKKH